MPEPRFLNLRDGGNLPRRTRNLVEIAVICILVAVFVALTWQLPGVIDGPTIQDVK